MYTLIDASQKYKKSNSAYFLNIIKNDITSNLFSLKNSNYKDIDKSIKKSDTIVLAFPIYVDSPPSILLNYMEHLFDNIDLSNKRLYCIINCGFREGEQNIIAANIIKNFCYKKNIKYSGSLLIGAGEIVGNNKYNFITKKAHKKLNEFKDIIKNNKITNDIIVSIDYIANRTYCFLANLSWNKNAKKNNIDLNQY